MNGTSLIAIAALAAIAAAYLIGRRLGWDGSMAREDLGQIAFIGPVMQIFLAGWILYRVGRVSTKGVRWLFPDPSRELKRRRSL